MKLAVLTNILAPYRAPLFEAVQGRVEDFTVLLMAEREENRQWRVEQPGFRTEVLPGFHVKPGHADVSLHVNYGVLKALCRLDPDVVISGGFGPANLAALLYCRRFGKKFVGWAHLTLQDGGQASWVKRAIRRWVIQRSDGSIAESSDARDAFVHYGAKKDRVLTAVLPLDVKRIHQRVKAFRGTEGYKALREKFSAPILLSIGQAIERKGYHEIFRMYEKVVAVRPSVSLLLLGDGPLRAQYEEHIRNKGWKNVHFMGFIQAPDLPDYLAIGDVFVFHTLYDPFGLVLSEAMAAELPVVSSIYASATRELVEDGVTGYRIDPKRIEDSAITILKALSMSDEERATMGRAAYEGVKGFDADSTAARIVSFCESLR